LLAFDQVDQTVLPWKVPGPKDVTAQQDLVTIVPALKALRQTIPSLETLGNERDQGADGDAVSSLIRRVQQITPKSRALQDRVERQVREACGDRSTMAAQLKATDAKLTAADAKLKAADAKLRGKLEHVLDEFVVDQLQHLGGLSVRSYAVGQRLLVHKDATWLEQAVLSHSAPGGAQHELEGTNGQLSIVLHPWNHAPLVLSIASFQKLRVRHASTLRSQHASIVDALSGQRLDIFDQCVPIKVVATAEQPSSDLAKLNEVAGLAKWLLAAHAARRDAADAGRKASLLLTAPPAAGKTCLMSQLVMHVLKSEECDMVPILVKVQELQRHLLTEASRPVFERSWNWVDAFLQCVHGAGSDLYRMLRQALMARRALVLLDGIDEGGKARDVIERHVTEVLAPQGHIMLITSRPNGLNEERFRQYFRYVKLAPLSEAQQEEVIVKRLGEDKHSDLLEYLHDPDRVPLDHETQQRVTGNPLMLSMIISIFQSKKGTPSAMPATITELYATASRAMLERVGRKERGAAAAAAAVPHLASLLEATFFQAHAEEMRNFGDEQLNCAALALFAPDNMKELAAMKLEVKKIQTWESDRIRLENSQSATFESLYNSRDTKYKVGTIYRYNGKEMVISSADIDGGYEDWGTDEHWVFIELKETEQSKAAAKAQYETRFNHACAALPTEAQETLRAVRERVAQDRLPLLSLLEAEPLLMRSSHLSFQEYFAVRAICTGKHRLPSDSPPWKWGPFWANVVKMGSENRASFGAGLLRAAGVDGDKLNLSKQLGGDRPSVLGVVSALLGSLRVLDLSDNELGPEGGTALAEGLEGNSTLESLKYRPPSAQTSATTRLLFVSAPIDTRLLSHHPHPTPHSLGNNKIGDQGASALAAILKETQITNLGCAAAQVLLL
jgi:hypothetical protein